MVVYACNWKDEAGGLQVGDQPGSQDDPGQPELQSQTTSQKTGPNTNKTSFLSYTHFLNTNMCDDII